MLFRVLIAAFGILGAAAGCASEPPARLGPVDGAGLAPHDLDRVQIGDAAPDFTLEAVDGRRVTLSQFRGRSFVLLTFYRGHW